jgi:transcriptional regulator with XRE-family HTH domain
MHWVQTIRVHLKISQEELATYLGLSLHTLQSVEQGRRQLPLTSMRPAMIIFQAITVSRASDPGSGFVMKADHHARHRKRLHSQYHRKLNQCACRLEAMQRSYATGTANLTIYLHLAQSLSEDDTARRKWTQRKIEETARQVKDNDTDAQELLHLQVTALKSITRTLEERQTNDHPDAPT